MSYRLIEGCCGTAALSSHLCQIKKPLLAYQGSKWRYRIELEKILITKGYSGPPHEIELYDPSPWSQVIKTLTQHQNAVVKILQQWKDAGQKNVFDLLQGSPASKDPIYFAAQFLFLQRLSFSGKAVGCQNGIWNSPGFNKTSAYGKAATDKFGEIKPMLSSLIEILKKENFGNLPVIKTGQFLNKQPAPVFDTVVYIDPPYQSSTKYPDGDLSRTEVVDLALAWSKAGAFVMVSEAEPIKELIGWNSIFVSNSKTNKSPFKSKKAEWVTVNR